MSTSKVIAVLAATAMVGLFSASAFAELIPQEEIQQYSGSDKPDVDAGASKGPDASIVDQEKNQFGNDAGQGSRQEPHPRRRREPPQDGSSKAFLAAIAKFRLRLQINGRGGVRPAAVGIFCVLANCDARSR